MDVISEAGIRYERIEMQPDLVIAVRQDVEAAARKVVEERERRPVSVAEMRILAAEKVKQEMALAQSEAGRNALKVKEQAERIRELEEKIQSLQEKASEAKLALPAGASRSFDLLKEVVAA